MKHHNILLGGAALASVLAGAWPVVGQTVQPAVQVEGQEVQAEGPKPAKDRGDEGKDAPVPAGRDAGQETAKKTDDWGFRWTDHPSLRLGPGTRVDFRLRLQGDLQHSGVELTEAGEDAGSSVDIARRRIGIDGEILNIFDYQVERELGDNDDPWRDVYVNYKQHNFAQFQAGKFKMPFSLDENTGATNLDFVYRSRIASLLAPGRDTGVMAHGRVLRRGVIRYEVGLFSADGDNVRTNDSERVHGERTVAARVLAQPFRSTDSPASDLAFGVSFTTSELPEGVVDLRGRTELGDVFYRPEILVNGQRRRIGFEARWRPGPFSIKSEYIRLTDERLGQSVENTDLAPFVSAGWYVSGTWAVTGERKADGLDSPRRPLFQGGFGAVEVAVRVERIRFGSGAVDPLASNSPRADVVLGNSDHAQTYGVNWYVNRWIKIQANLVRNAIAFPDQAPQPPQPVFWSRLIRFQFSM